ncbi:uncharacterized protein LOC126919996 [Bombus affinis]|nr:uncharacterized protein LOC126919996 [Bombus affinis]
MRACKSGFQERKIIHASGKGRGRKRIKRIGPSSSTRSIRIRFFIYCPISNRKMISWSFVWVTIIFAKYVMASIEGSPGGWQGISAGNDYGSGHGLELGGLSSYGSYGGGGLDHGLHGGQVHYAEAVPVSEHVEITRPVPVPVVKNVGVPVAQPVAIGVPHPVAVGVPQPYPVHVPVAKPVAIPVVKTVAVPVEKKVPFPVEKVIPVPVEKHVPVPVEKHIPVPVEKPYPIHVPVYKHVFHRVKSHGHGWSH